MGENDQDQDEGGRKRQPGPLTLMTSAAKLAEEAAAKERAAQEARAAEDRAALEARDARQDERTDKAYGLALEQANRRAEDSERDKARAERIVKFQWLVIGALVLAVIALAGHAVYVKVAPDGSAEVRTTPGSAP